jgi:hypothetical protein
MIAASFPLSEADAAHILEDVEEPSEEPKEPPHPPPGPPAPFGGPPVPPAPPEPPEPRDDGVRMDRIEESGPPGKRWCVVSQDGTRIACHRTKVEAERQLAAIEARKHGQ